MSQKGRQRTKPDEYAAVMAYLLSYDCVRPAGGRQQPFPTEDVPTLTSVELGTVPALRNELERPESGKITAELSNWRPPTHY